MKNVLWKRSVATVGLTLAIAGCGGAGTNPTAAGGTAPMSRTVNAPPAVDGIAGFYKGTAKLGNTTGKAKLWLSQNSSSAGGTLSMTFGTIALTSAVAMTVATNHTATGTAIVYQTTPPSQSTCSVSVTNVRYNPVTFLLTGKYAAFRGCAGTNGSFRLKEKCYYVVAAPKAVTAVVRPNGAVPMAC